MVSTPFFSRVARLGRLFHVGAAFVLIGGLSTPGYAQFTITTNTTNSPQVTSAGTNSIAAGITLTLTNIASGNASTVTIGGAHTFLVGSGATASSARDADASGEIQDVVLVSGANATIVNNGFITQSGNAVSGGGARTVNGIRVTGAGLSLTNSGTISVTGAINDEAMQTISVTGANMTVTNNAGAFITSVGAAPVFNLLAGSGGFNLSNSGTVSAGGTGRAIDTANSDLGTVTIANASGATIQSSGEDAIRVRGNTSVAITNSGTIYSGPNLAGTPTGTTATGQALDLASAEGGTIVNNSTGLIRADGHDAVRLGSNMTFTNHGTVRGNGAVNDSPANNNLNTPPGSTAETYSASDGVSFENGSNSTVDNYGTISGARHGVETDVSATNITITNRSTGQMIGRNGSGVGSDATNGSASNIVVNNYGVIRGDYAGVGNVIDRTGSASVTNDGDGDGVDIDGAATINNFSTGQILSTGAGGFDSSGRLNNSEAISIGGGVIVNDGLIRGAGRGILVNNDSVVSRSGIAAASITNNSGATIEGLAGFAIRLENKLGTAADNDTIVNAGTIVGNGTIPDPSAIVLIQNNTPDANSVGTLDGTTYTGTGSARFIRGDGAAIQMGEGNDTLTNTGTITGNTGRAINLEGGNDTLNFNGGTITGSINGGAGTDTFALGAGVSNSSAVQNFETFTVSSGVGTLSGIVSGTTLTKTGAGTLALSGANTYTGTTTVSAGTLLVNNSTGSGTGSGPVVVDSGAKLGGGGFIGGDLSLTGMLAPGNSIGTLTATGNVTWNGSLANKWEFELGAANASDRLDIGGNFTKGTGSDFAFDFLNGATTGSFVLVDWAGSTTFTAGDFSYFNLGSGLLGSFAINGSQLEFTVTASAIPEPSTTVALAGAAVLGIAWWSRRKRAAR